MPTEAYAHGGLCPVVPHLYEKGYISFPSFCDTAIRDRTEFMFCVFSPTTSRPAITDSIYYRSHHFKKRIQL